MSDRWPGGLRLHEGGDTTHDDLRILCQRCHRLWFKSQCLRPGRGRLDIPHPLYALRHVTLSPVILLAVSPPIGRSVQEVILQNHASRNNGTNNGLLCRCRCARDSQEHQGRTLDQRVLHRSGSRTGCHDDKRARGILASVVGQIHHSGKNRFPRKVPELEKRIGFSDETARVTTDVYVG